MHGDSNIDNCKEVFEYNNRIKEEIFKLCEPLFKAFNINNFGYTRYNKDGSRNIIDLNEEWLEAYLRHHFYENPNIPRSLLYNLRKATLYKPYIYYMCLEKPQTYYVYEILRDTGLGKTLSIYLKDKNYAEIFHFNPHPNDGEFPIDQINHLDFLKHFILYFKDKAYSFIDPKKIPKVFVDGWDGYLKSVSSNNQDRQDKMKDFLKATKLKKIWLPGLNVSLSLREMECIYHWAKGKSYKEISRALAISSKTVETYLSKARSKLSINNNSDLIRVYERKAAFLYKGLG